LRGQEPDLIPPQKLLRDFERAVEIIEAHPSPYRLISEEQMQNKIDSARKQLDHPMDEIAFYKLISSVYASIRDGHSSVQFEQSWIKSYQKEHGVFPYSVFLSKDNELFLIQNYGPDSTIAPGARILALNDVPTEAFIQSVNPFISYELEGFRNAIISERFDIYLMLAFGKINNIRLTYSSDSMRSHTIEFIPYNVRKKLIDDEEERINNLIEKGEPYEYSLIADKVGRLNIHSFGLNAGDFESFLDHVFRRIQKDDVHSLILDVRGNTGGYMFAVSDLVHRLTDKPFKITALSEMKVSKSFLEYFQTYVPAINFRRGLITQHSYSIADLFKHKPGEYIVEKGTYQEMARNIYHRFSGDLYLLIDGQSFSASASFAAVFRCYQLGLIVGSETGGTRVFHANNMFIQLPSTQLVCSMATTRVYTPCYNAETEGIKPDFEINPSIYHLVSGRDAPLEYCLHLIQKVQKLKQE
jgi:hypothetical protein